MALVHIPACTVPIAVSQNACCACLLGADQFSERSHQCTVPACLGHRVGVQIAAREEAPRDSTARPRNFPRRWVCRRARQQYMAQGITFEKDPGPLRLGLHGNRKLRKPPTHCSLCQGWRQIPQIHQILVGLRTARPNQRETQPPRCSWQPERLRQAPEVNTLAHFWSAMRSRNYVPHALLRQGNPLHTSNIHARKSCRAQ